jgi:MiaB-like tRNA modifying enzyme
MKVYIKTFGCSLNLADSEAMAGILEKEGNFLVNSSDEADLIVINSCAVKNEAENKLFRELRKNKDKKIVVTGCVPQSNPSYLKTKLKDYSILGVNQLDKVAGVAEEVMNGSIVQLISKEKKERVTLPKHRLNLFVEIIPICEGCMDSCNYCKTKHARGSLYSYRPREIREAAFNALNEGVKEIWLTSQDNGCYGFDIGTNSAELINNICEHPNKDFKLRFGMANPHHIKKILPQLIEAFKNPQVYKFLHIPIQSGSDKVLEEMKRTYTAKDYLDIVEEFRNNIPGITISTDIIVAYPTESEKDFKETLKILEKSKPEIVNISRFWPRPGTPAARLKPLPSQVAMKRSKQVKELCNRIGLERNKNYVGKKLRVLITEAGKNTTMKGKAENYMQVITKKEAKIGQSIEVLVKTATPIDVRDF